MTDSESDFGTISLENGRRIRQLLHNAYGTQNETFSIREIASSLGVSQKLVIQHVERNPEVLFYPESNTVRLRRDRDIDRSANLNNSGGGGVGGGGAVHGSNMGAGGGGGGLMAATSSGGGGGVLTRPPWEQFEAVAAVKKAKHRRPLGKSTDIRAVVPDATKGRVGYVCVADEFDLEELEKYYAEQGYYTKCDYDVLHIRFSDKEMQKQQGHATTASLSSAAAASSALAASARTRLVTPGSATSGSPSGSPGGAATFGATNSNNNNRRATTSAVDDAPLGPTKSNQGLLPVMSSEPSDSSPAKKHGFDLFVFQYGAIVWWGFDQKYFKIVEQDFMFPSSKIQKYLVNRYRTQIINEIYPVWCTYSLERNSALEPDDDFKERLLFDHFLIPFSAVDLDSACISMLCASHALAQSAKIDYLEIKIQDLTQSCKPLPRELKEYGRVTITERRLLQLRGEVLSYRLMLKSGSDLLDEPELFWQNAYLKPIFQATKECFEITERVRALDTKLDAGNEILSMIADQFTERHGARLEWIVIWLVLVEVIIGVLELLLDVKPWLT